MRLPIFSSNCLTKAHTSRGISSGRYGNEENIQPVIQVLSEFTVSHIAGEIPGIDDPDEILEVQRLPRGQPI